MTERRVESVEISAEAESALRGLAETAYPHEGCGVLIGGMTAEGTIARISEVTSARNMWTERAADRYDLDPADFLAAERLARERGRDVVGIWHSHPDHPAHPSQFDTDRAWLDYAYLIVKTTASGSADLNAFSLETEGGVFTQVAFSVGAERS